MDKTELVEKAKKLGIKGAHLYGVDKLVEEIDKCEAEQKVTDTPSAPERKIAPRMSVSSVNRDNGLRTVMKLDKEFPEYKHMLQPKDIDRDVLAEKGLEFTGKTIGNEIVCRTDRESFEEWQQAGNREARRMMESIDPDGEQIMEHTVAPKKPRDADKTKP